MQLFTPKARRLIDGAVAQLTDDHLRTHWTAWVAAHPEIRTSQSNQHDVGDLPRNAAAVALAALENVASDLKHKLCTEELSEDDYSDIENSLAYIGTVENVLLGAMEAERPRLVA